MGDPQAYSRPPNEATKMTAVVTTASVAMPRASTRGACFVRSGVFRNALTATTARIPSGRLNQKAQRHPIVSTNQPPRIGPSTDAKAQAPPRMPR